MKEITQIRSLSLWVFLVPLISINICLFVSVNFHIFENTFFSVDQIGRSGFTVPYLDGSLSISRASRTFPQFLIFKPAMVVTAFLLCVYWHKNNILINHFKNSKEKKNNFMIFGKLKNQLKDFFYPNILKLKILLVSILIFVALISIPILIISENVHFKHGLEWNYFVGVILFYLLTSLLWKKIP
jgi:hypothetical protein